MLGGMSEDTIMDALQASPVKPPRLAESPRAARGPRTTRSLERSAVRAGTVTTCRALLTALAAMFLLTPALLLAGLQSQSEGWSHSSPLAMTNQSDAGLGI